MLTPQKLHGAVTKYDFKQLNIYFLIFPDIKLNHEVFSIYVSICTFPDLFCL